MKFKLDHDYLRDAGLPFDADDLRFALARDLISPDTAIALARDARASGAVDPILERISRSHPPDVYDARELGSLDNASPSTTASTRKWLYLQLKAAYEARHELKDPLGVVEQIYSDFDYPPSIVPLVRYMPAESPENASVAGVMEAWVEFLRLEGQFLRVNPRALTGSENQAEKSAE